MKEKRIRLKVLGMSTGEITRGAYALVLAQADGPVRIPVVIGEAEARAIASKMDCIPLPRPMTHDLFATFAHAFGIAMLEVFIYKFEDGIFYSEVAFTDGERRVNFEARTSDAVALAMRTGAPIYCTAKILHECGFVTQNDPSATPRHEEPKEPTIEELERLRDEAVDAENYEEASRLTEIINQKKHI